jgi:UDP-N-acetylmuramoyl-tripeptide--D-alanyl-D-alanine ligase
MMAEGLPSGGTLFLSGDDEWSDSLARRTCARIVRAGLNEGNDYRAVDIRCDETGSVFWIRCREARLEGQYRIQLLGRHQVANAVLAMAVGAELEADRAQIERGLALCGPSKMRLQIRHAGGVRVLDDAYNANADSMRAALETLRDLPCPGRRIAALGDMAELGEAAGAAHAEAGQRAAEQGLDQLFAVGTRAAELAAAARAGGLRHVAEFPDAASAARAVKEFVRPGDTVLVKASRAMRLEQITETLMNLEAKHEE